MVHTFGGRVQVLDDDSYVVHPFERHVSNLQGVVHHRQVRWPRQSVTDASICEIVGNDSLVLTADLPLANVLEHLGGHVINFNHIRVLGW